MTVAFSIWQIVAYRFSKSPAGFKKRGKWWADFILRPTGYRLKVVEKEKLREGPYIFVSNHQNALDIPVHLSGIPVPCAFVAKADLAKMPFLGWALRSSNNIFVDRSTARKAVQSLNDAAEQIKKGQSVLIYPEGRRTWSADMTEFLKGAFQLAGKAGVKIVPIALINTYEFMDERRMVSKPGKIVFVIGSPVELDEESRKKPLLISAKVRDAIEELISDGRSHLAPVK